MATINVTSSGTVAVGDNDTVRLNITGGGDVTLTGAPDVDFMKVRFLGDTEADSITLDLSTFAQDDLRIDLHQYDPNDSIGFIGGSNFAIDPNDSSRYVFDYIGSDGQTYSGYLNAMDGGENDFTDPFTPITIICFADGTLIDTPTGAVAVETLRPGDMVMTRDSGPLPLRWVGRRALTADDLAAQPELQPIHVAAHSFGPNQPARDLTVSPHHRLMVSDWQIDLLFGEAEALAEARFFEGMAGVTRAHAPQGIGYNHLLFDRHEIVTANGMPCESLFPGPVALTALDDGALSEISALFPEALDEDVDIGPPARQILREFEARVLLSQAAHQEAA